MRTMNKMKTHSNYLRPLRMNKRGSFTDLFLLVIIAFILLVFVAIFIYAGNTLSNKLNEQSAVLSVGYNNMPINFTEIKSGTFDNVVISYKVLYWGSIVIIFGMMLSVLIGSYMVTTKPIFFIPYLIVLIIAIGMSIVIANVYDALMKTPELASTFAGMIGANYIMLYLPRIVGAIGLLGGIIMYINMQRGRAYG